MDEPARKRRRTASPGDRERASSPLKKPPRRPSFASPTKASLARFNPNLLARPTSAGHDGRADTLHRGKQARTFIFGETEGETQEKEAAPRGNKTDVRADPNQRRVSKVQKGAPPPRRTGLATRSPVPLEDMEEDEAELPSPPSALATEQQDTPRRGVLYSSPMKRPPRMMPFRQSPMGSRQQDREPGRSFRLEDGVAKNGGVQGGAENKRQPPDPVQEKKRKEKEKMLREIQELEDDIAHSIKQIRKLQSLPPTQDLDSSERNDVISLINKTTNSNEMAEEQDPLVSNLLCSFLPFMAHVVAPPLLKDVLEETIPSHKPLTLEDPLPYLGMFTSFEFTSHVHLPSSGDFDSVVGQFHQKHNIDIVGPQKLLMSSVEVNVDTRTYLVTKLQILRLSDWAERELGSFIRGKEEEKDLSSICWAISSYWEIAKKRAEYWYKCEKTFTQLIPGRTSDDTENIGHINGKIAVNISRKDLLRHLGRDSFVLEDRHILLKITWRIAFDWTGEAESVVDIEPAFPKVWSEADNNDGFRKIPEIFGSLVDSKGMFEATRTIVTLLFSE